HHRPRAPDHLAPAAVCPGHPNGLRDRGGLIPASSMAGARAVRSSCRETAKGTRQFDKESRKPGTERSLPGFLDSLYIFAGWASTGRALLLSGRTAFCRRPDARTETAGPLLRSSCSEERYETHRERPGAC